MIDSSEKSKTAAGFFNFRIHAFLKSAVTKASTRGLAEQNIVICMKLLSVPRPHFSSWLTGMECVKCLHVFLTKSALTLEAPISTYKFSKLVSIDFLKE